MTGPTASVAAMIMRDAASIPQDKLDRARSGARRLRDAELAVSDAEEVLKEKSAEYQRLRCKELPDLFDEVGISSVGLEAEDNFPAVTAKSRPFYKASIPKDNEDEAFAWLEARGVGDMIRNVFSVELPKDSEEEAKILEEFLRAGNYDYARKKAVPWGTLTAFVREEIEENQRTPPLSLLGATVGKVVELKTVTEKKAKKQK